MKNSFLIVGILVIVAILVLSSTSQKGIGINAQSGNFGSSVATWSGNSSVPATITTKICYYLQTPNGTWCGAAGNSYQYGVTWSYTGGTPFAGYLIDYSHGQQGGQGIISQTCTTSLVNLTTSSQFGSLQTMGTYPPASAFHTYQYQNLIGQNYFGTVQASQIGDLCNIQFPSIGGGSNGGAASGGVSVTSQGKITFIANPPGYYPVNQSYYFTVTTGQYYPTIFFVKLVPLPNATTTTTAPTTSIPQINTALTTSSTTSSTTTIPPSTTTINQQTQTKSSYTGLDKWLLSIGIPASFVNWLTQYGI
ncbi:MAG: hypothetical protein KGH62_01955 [Candidatus Micrarchaeota archaeon]|nr:hypothetical protein [Candidatus Micrarchaeota archaeon]